MKELSITVLILTKNEEIHIARAINSIKPISSKIFVIDSYSKDETVSIAKNLGAKIFTHRFINQAIQMQWAIDNLKINTEWVMRLDADELISSDLVNEIIHKLPNMSDKVNGIILKRKHIFMNKIIRFGGRGSLSILRIWRNGHAYIEKKYMDEHICIKDGLYTHFHSKFFDWNLKGINFFIVKHNEYATREAAQKILACLSKNSNNKSLVVRLPFFLAIKRFFKDFIYDAMPYQISSLLYFIWRYVFMLGFLDGVAGFNYHFLQAFWYRFLIGLKMDEIKELIKGINNKKKIRLIFLKLYKIDINVFDN